MHASQTTPLAPPTSPPTTPPTTPGLPSQEDSQVQSRAARAQVSAGDPQPAPQTQSKSQSNHAQQKSARASVYPEPIDRLIVELTKLPGIGRRSAERLAFFVLKSERADALALARAIADVKQAVRHCDVCMNLTDDRLCSICKDPTRDRSRVLVVEQPKDLIALEQTGMYRGLYHVLMGKLSPLEGVGPGELTIAALMHRIESPQANPGSEPIVEIILGLNPNLEGDGTSLYIARHAGAKGVRITRLARGLPTGSQLEYVSKAVLADAIEGRSVLD